MRNVLKVKSNEKREKSMHGMNTLLEDVLEDFRIERVLECQESDEDVRDIKIASSVKQLICEGLCCNLFNSILNT